MERNKEVVMNLIIIEDDKGFEFYACPRCNYKKRSNILEIQYCKKCGQHIAPFVFKKEDEPTKTRNSLSVEDLKKVKI